MGRPMARDPFNPIKNPKPTPTLKPPFPSLCPPFSLSLRRRRRRNSFLVLPRRGQLHPSVAAVTSSLASPSLHRASFFSSTTDAAPHHFLFLCHRRAASSSSTAAAEPPPTARARRAGTTRSNDRRAVPGHLPRYVVPPGTTRHVVLPRAVPLVSDHDRARAVSGRATHMAIYSHSQHHYYANHL